MFAKTLFAVEQELVGTVAAAQNRRFERVGKALLCKIVKSSLRELFDIAVVLLIQGLGEFTSAWIAVGWEFGVEVLFVCV